MGKKEAARHFLRVCGAIFTFGSLVYLVRSGARKEFSRMILFF